MPVSTLAEHAMLKELKAMREEQNRANEQHRRDMEKLLQILASKS